ncbi:uncharacterized protein LOC122540862 [Chiloscyllium plagiosum]|uniref:uncharacterized protein LOC122540862 n=1 Tax=Chiloscyllium plagiosum TaxID=36176 RepID=UPI001CB83C70|nr:uncharacterized protein LOC122540862 [Chiloscyllium plagiosum]
MASFKTEKNWTDLQESLNRVRQQLGLIPRAEWDNFVPSEPPLRVCLTSQCDRWMAHTPSNLPGLHTNVRRVPQREAPPLFSGKTNGKKEALRKQPLGKHKRSSVPDAAMIISSDLPLENRCSMRQQAHESSKKGSPGTGGHSSGLQREHAAFSFFKENQSFAWNFVDWFILEMLEDELVPDTLMEVLSHDVTKCAPAYSPTGKNFDVKRKLPETVKLDVLKQLPAVTILDTLLEEAVSEMTVGLIRRVVEELVENHLTNTAINDSLTELIVETVEPMVPQLVKETVNETLLEGILQEDILPEVLDEEMRNVAVLLLSEYDTETHEEQQQAVSTNADQRLLDMFLLEGLLKILRNQGRELSEMIELDRLLDSWMLDVLIGQYLNITQHCCLITENVALKDYHRKAFTDVVLDVILSELSEHMDEDLADLFQYEQQMEERNLIADGGYQRV